MAAVMLIGLSEKIMTANDSSGFSEYRKQGSVFVNFAACDGVLDTLEGQVRYLSGDAIMTGVEDEHWPVKRAKFEVMYVPDEGQTMGIPGRYCKTMVVRAKQMEAPFTVKLGQGDTLTGEAGDWLILYPDGSQAIVANRIFQQTYRKV